MAPRAIICADGVRVSHRGKVVMTLAQALDRGVPYRVGRMKVTERERNGRYFDRYDTGLRELCSRLDRGDTIDVLAKCFPVHHIPEMILRFGTSRAWIKLPVIDRPTPKPRRKPVKRTAAKPPVKRPTKKRKAKAESSSSEEEEDEEEEEEEEDE